MFVTLSRFHSERYQKRVDQRSYLRRKLRFFTGENRECGGILSAESGYHERENFGAIKEKLSRGTDTGREHSVPLPTERPRRRRREW